MSIANNLQELGNQLSRIDNSKNQIIGRLLEHGSTSAYYGMSIDNIADCIGEIAGGGSSGDSTGSFGDSMQTYQCFQTNSDYAFSNLNFSCEMDWTGLSNNATKAIVLFVPNFNAPILMGKIDFSALSGEGQETLDSCNLTTYVSGQPYSGTGSLYYSYNGGTYVARYDTEGYFGGNYNYEYGQYELTGSFYVISQVTDNA